MNAAILCWTHANRVWFHLFFVLAKVIGRCYVRVMTPGGGRTDWDSHSIADIIAKVQSMDSAQAAADAAALASAVTSAQAVATRLSSVFSSTSPFLKGAAATAGDISATTVASDISNCAASASQAIAALTNAGGTLALARATELVLSAFQGQMVADPKNAAQLKSAVTAMMNSHYSDPMSGTNVPEGATSGTAAGGRGTGSASGPDVSAANGGQGSVQSPTSTIGSSPGASPSASPNTATPAPSNAIAHTSTARQPNAVNTGAKSANNNGGNNNANGREDSGRSGADNGGNHNGANNSGRTIPTGAAPDRDKPFTLVPTPGGHDAARGNVGRVGASPAPTLVPRRLGGASLVPTAASPTTNSPTAAGQQSGRSSSAPYAPHASRSRGGSDGKHSAAPYLSTKEHGEEVVGSLPLVGPPVLGDWMAEPPNPDEPAPNKTDPNRSE